MRAAIFITLAACGTNLTPQPEPVPELPSCVPDRDGTITADELPIAYGATVAYYVSAAGATRTINTAAANRHWDLSEETNDAVIALGPTELKVQWYAPLFPAGQFAVDGGGGLDGIYHQDDRALWLDGTASHEMMPPAGRTAIRYAQPIAVLRFPIADGDTYSTTAAIPDGVTAGLPFIGTDQVDVDVTGDGSLDVPYVRFSPALRVRTKVTRKPSTGTPVVTRRNTIFLFECFGEVARAESRVDEPAADFTTAAYLRRFALGETP